MGSSVALVTDSTAHLQPGAEEACAVTVVPLQVVIDDNSYNAGSGRMFWLLRLSQDEIMQSLQAVGLDVQGAKVYPLEDEGVIFGMFTKL